LSQDEPRTLWTIGHSTLALDRLISLLQEHQIEVLVDVRSKPYSRHVPHFNAPALRGAVFKHGIEYRLMGDSLGGRPPESDFYDQGGYVLYSLLAGSMRFQRGLEVLQEAASVRRVAILCSEEDPLACHRSLLIGRVLLRDGWSLIHIRASGAVISGDQVDRSRQTVIFEEPSAWRSIRSVLSDDPLKTSFKH
jgi:uncharacterized protein (DUF488 family)